MDGKYRVVKAHYGYAAPCGDELGDLRGFGEGFAGHADDKNLMGKNTLTFNGDRNGKCASFIYKLAARRHETGALPAIPAARTSTTGSLFYLGRNVGFHDHAFNLGRNSLSIIGIRNRFLETCDLLWLHMGDSVMRQSKRRYSQKKEQHKHHFGNKGFHNSI